VNQGHAVLSQIAGEKLEEPEIVIDEEHAGHGLDPGKAEGVSGP
jgi:hypothetical protein